MLSIFMYWRERGWRSHKGPDRDRDTLKYFAFFDLRNIILLDHIQVKKNIYV